MATGEIPGHSSASDNRHQLYRAIIAALTPETYCRDGHYIEVETPSFGNFTVSDYLASLLVPAAEITAPQELQEFRRNLLNSPDPRTCIDITPTEPNRVDTDYVLVHSGEELRLNTYAMQQFAPLMRQVDPDTLCIFRTETTGGLPGIVDDPFQDPILREVYNSLPASHTQK